MSFQVIFSRKAASELKKLPDEIQERIIKKLKETKESPFQYFERLKGRVDFKLRVGDYRLIADIKSDIRRVEVTKIGHRKKIYKRY